jgi:hypothetical protein
LPARGADANWQTVAPGGQEKVAPPGRLEAIALGLAQVERLLQPGRVGWTLGTKEMKRRVHRDHGAGLAAQEVAWVLGGEDQGALIFANPSCQGDHEAADGGVFKEQAKFIDHQEPPAVSLLDSGPERLSQQVVDRRHHLGSKLTHTKGDQGRLQVDVGGTAEDLAKASAHPAREDPAQA